MEMKNRPSAIKKTFQSAALLAVAVTLATCGPPLTYFASWETNDDGNDMSVPPLRNDEFAQMIANKFGLMALFAEVAYRRDLNEKARDNLACNYLYTDESDDFGMPTDDGEIGKWMRWRGNELGLMGTEAVKPCVNEAGLFYETYVYQNGEGMLEEAVIAFRGTENRVGQLLEDWRTNLSAVFGIQPEQYRLASKYIPPLIESLKQKNPNIRIYAVGHSLGGGMAQQAGYQSKDILQVITFNTSPVTNWTYLRLGRNVRNNYPNIFRIYHNGEALEKVRFFTTSFTSTRYGRYDIGVQFKEKSNFKGHSMSIFACVFAALIASEKNTPEKAEHHYGKNYALQKVVKNKVICGDDNYEQIIHQLSF